MLLSQFQRSKDQKYYKKIERGVSHVKSDLNNKYILTLRLAHVFEQDNLFQQFMSEDPFHKDFK